MLEATPRLRRDLERRYRHCPIDCLSYRDSVITSLSDFLQVFHYVLEPSKPFWFRGHTRVEYGLAPSALRHSEIEKRERALGLVADMRRFLEMKLARPPAVDNDLGWMQVAQHYGLQTRLLDWTQNAAVALFFACFEHPDADGLVVILNPLELNQRVDPHSPRLFNPHRDRDMNIISPYLQLGGSIDSRGKPTIAISPAWNTERIAMQQGAFTLHGSQKFELDRRQASSLVYIPILKEYKKVLLDDLERVGVGEMFVYPEPEHVCAHLLRAAGLER